MNQNRDQKLKIDVFWKKKTSSSSRAKPGAKLCLMNSDQRNECRYSLSLFISKTEEKSSLPSFYIRWRQCKKLNQKLENFYQQNQSVEDTKIKNGRKSERICLSDHRQVAFPVQVQLKPFSIEQITSHLNTRPVNRTTDRFFKKSEI